LRISAITADRRDEFATGDGTLPDIGPLTAALWTSGDSRPQWCWLATRRGRVLARVGFRVVEDPDDPPPASAFEPELLAAAWRRVPYTVGLFGLAYAPGPDGLAAAEELIRTAVGAAVERGTVVEARTNPEAHPDAAARVELLGQAGFGLFQEKQGYAWAARRSRTSAWCRRTAARGTAGACSPPAPPSRSGPVTWPCCPMWTSTMDRCVQRCWRPGTATMSAPGTCGTTD